MKPAPSLINAPIAPAQPEHPKNPPSVASQAKDEHVDIDIHRQ